MTTLTFFVAYKIYSKKVKNVFSKKEICLYKGIGYDKMKRIKYAIKRKRLKEWQYIYSFQLDYVLRKEW